MSSISSFQEDTLFEIRKILELPAATKKAILQQAILKRLEHTELRQRYIDVDEAHSETFRWILEEDSSAESNQMLKSRNVFLNWLSQGEGFFHIAGKLGSGKSTLMKFLTKHHNTTQYLHRWSSMWNRVSYTPQLCLM